jgi:hypothetical protein
VAVVGITTGSVGCTVGVGVGAQPAITTPDRVKSVNALFKMPSIVYLLELPGRWEALEFARASILFSLASFLALLGASFLFPRFFLFTSSDIQLSQFDQNLSQQQELQPAPLDVAGQPAPLGRVVREVSFHCLCYVSGHFRTSLNK